MADAKQCDVCGSFYPAVADPDHFDKLRLGNHEMPFNAITYDLCPKCMDKIRKVLNNPNCDVH